FNAEPYAHIFSQFSNLETVFVTNTIAQRNIDAVRRVWVQDRLGSKLEIVCGAGKVSDRIGQHFYPAFIRIVRGRRRASISNAQDDSRSIRVGKGFPRTLSSVGNYSGTLRFSEHPSLPFNRSQSSQSGADPAKPNDNQNPSGEVFWPESLSQICFCLLLGGVLLFFGCRISYRGGGFWWTLLACLLNFVGLGMFLLTVIACNENRKEDAKGDCSHVGNTVPQDCCA